MCLYRGRLGRGYERPSHRPPSYNQRNPNNQKGCRHHLYVTLSARPTFFDRLTLPVVSSLWLALGVPAENTIPDDKEREVVSTFIYNKLPGLVRERKTRPNAITKWEGGLEKVPGAIEYLAAGKVSGAKIVFSL